MIGRLRRHPQYKDSSLPWLGEIPRHWTVGRLKSRCTSIIEQTSCRQPGELYVALHHVEGWTGRLRVADDDVAFDSQVNRFHANDVLFGKLRPYLAKVTSPKFPGVCVAEFLVLRPQRFHLLPAYLEHLLRSKPIIDLINSSTFGAKMPRADWQFVGAINLAFPPLPEQAAIVRFLNHADRRIQRYIRGKKKLIALLNEQKQAIIHQAVTRGLDPNVRLKPSGVEWLGDVPEDWSVTRAKNLFRLRTEKSGEQHGLELLSVYTHIGVRPRRELEERGNKASTTDYYSIVKRGDIIVNKLLAWMGAVGVSQYAGVTSPAYDILMPIADVVPDFYHYLFRTRVYLEQFKQRSRGIMDMRLRLYFDQLGQIPLLYPPRGEQATIVAFIDRMTQAQTAGIVAIAQEIALLQEFRSRLISDVVTGKLDAREAAAMLPDDAEDMEPLDDMDEAPEEIDDINLDASLEEVAS